MAVEPVPATLALRAFEGITLDTIAAVDTRLLDTPEDGALVGVVREHGCVRVATRPGTVLEPEVGCDGDDLLHDHDRRHRRTCQPLQSPPWTLSVRVTGVGHARG